MLIAAVAARANRGGGATSYDPEVEEFAIYFNVVTDTDPSPSLTTQEETGESHD